MVFGRGMGDGAWIVEAAGEDVVGRGYDSLRKVRFEAWNDREGFSGREEILQVPSNLTSFRLCDKYRPLFFITMIVAIYGNIYDLHDAL